MNSRTLARKRLTGEAPYKVPPEDGRRARWAAVHVQVTPAQFAAIKTAVQIALSEVLKPTQTHE